MSNNNDSVERHTPAVNNWNQAEAGSGEDEDRNTNAQSSGEKRTVSNGPKVSNWSTAEGGRNMDGNSSSNEKSDDSKDLERGDDSQDNEKEADDEPPTLASLKERISHFTWPWFATTMSTGALMAVLGLTPNRFTGLQTIGKIFFILDIVLFVLFSMAITARFILAPAKLTKSLHHPIEGLFFGTYWVSAALILEGIQIYGVPSSGPWLVTALRVLFWMYCAASLITVIAQYYVLFHKEHMDIGAAVPAWVFPTYPLLVVGPLAGLLIPSQPKEYAYTMWIGAVMLQGLGWMVALMIYTMYCQRLMISPLPPPPTRPGMFVSVGPAGYTATALFSLGAQAPNVVPPNAFGINWDIADGNVLKLLGIISGTFLILFSFWFFCLTIVAVLQGVRSMTFTLNWWAFIFPNAGLCLAAIQMGSAYNSSAINGICSALTIALVIMWLIVAAGHIQAVWHGKILWPGKDEDKDMPPKVLKTK